MTVKLYNSVWHPAGAFIAKLRWLLEFALPAHYIGIL